MVALYACNSNDFIDFYSIIIKNCIYLRQQPKQ